MKMADSNASTSDIQSIKEAILNVFSLLIDQFLLENQKVSNTDVSEEHKDKNSDSEENAV